MPLDPTVIAALIQESSRALTEYLRTRPIASKYDTDMMSIQMKRQQVEDTYTQSFLAGPPVTSSEKEGNDGQLASKSMKSIAQPKTVRVVEVDAPREEDSNVAVKAQSIAVGCVPCALGHIGTCSGLLNEAVRFSDNGMDDAEVIERLNGCLDELNGMERIDLRPEKISSLPEWERKIADRALKSSRTTRHAIEGCRTKEDLVHLAANTQKVRNEIGKEWFQTKIRTFKPDEKAQIAEKVKERLSNDDTFSKEDQEEIARRVIERLEKMDAGAMMENAEVS